ncbi:MAG: family 43 glycosylhydrolase [Clostridia bacterium]|nr:family 43 glycosylhydrolase [Clostridia bacterium]
MKNQVYNPFLPQWEYVPDGEPHVFDGRVYLFGSHDMAGGQSFCVKDYVCWSAPVCDLSDWVCHGVIYRREQDPLNADGSHALFAPDVCRGKDGRYYLYYALDFVSVISVAVCDTPCGEYKFYGHVKCKDGHILSTLKGEPYAFDPAVLCENGEAYLYIGYCPYPPRHLMRVEKTYTNAWAYKFEDDILTVGEGKPIVPSECNEAGTGFEGHGFFEASSIRKVNGKYYFIYSSYVNHELCYAVSDSPDGNFSYGGVIISNGDIGINGITQEAHCNGYIGNNHGSIENINGEWYVFYHRHTNCKSFSRQACAEKIEVLSDGTILQAEMTSCGLNGKPLNGKGSYPAYIACNLSSGYGTMRGDVPVHGVHPFITQCGADGDSNSYQYIANLRQGAWCGFKYFEGREAAKITAVLRGYFSGIIRVTDGRNTLAEIVVSPSDGWQPFSADFKSPEGQFALYFTFKGEGAADFLSFDFV